MDLAVGEFLALGTSLLHSAVACLVRLLLGLRLLLVQRAARV